MTDILFSGMAPVSPIREPSIADVLCDIDITNIVDIGATEYEVVGNYDKSVHTWMPDVHLMTTSFFPISAPASFTDGVDTQTLSKYGVVTFNAAKTATILLKQRYTFSNVTSLRGVRLIINCPLAAYIKLIALATVGSSIGSVELYTGAGALIGSKRFMPLAPVDFNRIEIEAAGDGCYVDLVLDGYVAIAKSSWVLDYNPGIMMTADFKNKAEDILTALWGGLSALPVGLMDLSIGGRASLGDQIAGMLEKFLFSKMPPKLAQVLQDNMYLVGITFADIGTALAVGVMMAWQNDKSFDFMNYVQTRLLGGAATLVQQMFSSLGGATSLLAGGVGLILPLLTKMGSTPEKLTAIMRPAAAGIGGVLLTFALLPFLTASASYLYY